MRFIVVSDIYGYPLHMDWLREYGAIEFLFLGDLCDRPNLSGPDLHSYLFKQRGLECVASRLSRFPRDELHGLGFSAGGTALWRAAGEGMHLKRLVCVSSTRLRYERTRLAIPTHTFWGECDPHRPDEEWCHSIPNHSQVYPGLGHSFYHQASGVPSAAHQADLIRVLTD